MPIEQVILYRLNPDAFNLVESDLIVGAIIELCRPGAFVRGDRLRVFDCATILKIGSDSRCPKSMTADLVRQADSLCSTLDHSKGIVPA